MASEPEPAVQAFVTLVTSDNYVVGALVLAHSLRRTKTTRNIVVLATANISLEKRSQLQDVFDYVISVEELDSHDEAHLALLQRPNLGITFTKLHAFNLTQYRQCLFLDADTVVLQPVDELFDRDVEFAAAPDVGWPDCFNSGVFLFRPSHDTYRALLEHAATVGSFDGGDQGLLNSFFSWWAAASPLHRLPFTYNMTANASYGYQPAFQQFKAAIKIVHFIGAHKPWHGMPHPGPGMQAIVGLFEQWWRVRDDFDSCLSSSCSYKTLTGARPTRSPGRGDDANPPARRESAVSPRSSFDARRPLSGDYLHSLAFSEVQQAIDQLAAEREGETAAAAAAAAADDDDDAAPARAAAAAAAPARAAAAASMLRSLEAEADEDD